MLISTHQVRAAGEAARAGEPDVADVVRRAGLGDEAAWRGLVERYGCRVYALALSRLGSREAAEELTQSVFATLSEKLSGGAYEEEGRFESWLFRIANNRVRDEARRRGRRKASELDGESLAASDAPPADGEDLDALRRGVATLGESERELLSLRYQAGLAFKEISELVGEPVGTLLARHHRALGKLRGLLGDRTDEQP